jgi:hypothetical protein
MECCVTNKEIFKKILQLKNDLVEFDFCAKYYADDSELTTLLRQYEKTPFIYMLTHTYENRKCIIYIGKSCATSSRIILHKQKYEYDEIYLFRVKRGIQAIAEQKMIGTFTPLYNKAYNQEVYKELEKMGICYEGYKTKKQIREDFRMILNSHAMAAVTFFLPQKYIFALRDGARKMEKDINVYLSDLFEEMLPMESISESIRNFESEEEIASEMISVKEYAALYGKSVEQIKVHCRNGRLPAIKNQRDWMIPRSAPYPKDRRFR